MYDTTSLLSSNFHAKRKSYFTLCFQGRGDFHTSKTGISKPMQTLQKNLH